MKVLDVNHFQDGIQRYVRMLGRLELEMKEIENSIKIITGMDEELKGKGGAAIRSFYAECHMPFLQFFLLFKGNFDSILNNMREALYALESNQSGFIREQFLEGEVREGLQKVGNQTESLTNEANAYISNVSDIVALPRVRDYEVHSGIADAEKSRVDTVDSLNEFDSTQVSALSEVQDKISKMNSWISDLETLVTDGLTDVNFPAEEWKGYSSLTGLKKDLKGSEMDEEEEKSDYMGMATTVTMVAEEGIASFKLFRARDGLMTEGVNGGYRIYATQDALKKLGINPNEQARRDFLRKLPKDMSKWTPTDYDLYNYGNKTLLKAANIKAGDNGWSNLGDNVMIKHPHLLNWNKNTATAAGKAKIVGKAALSGTADGFKELVDLKGIKESGLLKGGVKALAPLAAGMSYYSNVQDAKKDGITGAGAYTRAAVDTTIDTAVSSAVQATATALGTAFIPIPGVGTAIGVGVGVVANWALNKKWGKSKESAMDKIKGWFR